MEESQISVKSMQSTIIVMLSFTRCALISKNASEKCQVIHAIIFKSLDKLLRTIQVVCDTEQTYLNNPVPATGHNNGVAAVGGEAHTRNPLRVAVILRKKGT